MSRQPTIAALQRTIDAMAAKLEREHTAWQREGVEGWKRYAARKSTRREIMNAARKHGRMVGPVFCDLLAARLVCVDVDAAGAHLSEETAAETVERWASEGPATKATKRPARQRVAA